jgi:hypothetical protein
LQNRSDLAPSAASAVVAYERTGLAESETGPEVEPEAESRGVGATSLIVPTITNDAVEGHPDRLGVDADARALAALVASRHLEPPLAIGLYGEWGSGKTFFMKRIQASVADLAASRVTNAFCSGVVHVWFSAWHYAEGNLWASLLHHIFASLHPEESRYQLALDELMAKVEGAQQVTSAVAANVEAAATRLEGADKAINAAKERHKEAIQESSKLRARDLWDAVKLSAAEEGLKDQVVEAADELGLSVATETARDLMGASRQVIDLASRVRVLATSRPHYRSPLAYAFYAAVFVGLLGLLIGAAVHRSNQWMGTAITATAQFAAVGSALAAWISRQAGLLRRFVAPAETLERHLQEKFAQQQAENERELAELQQEADATQAELTVAIQQHAAAEQQLVAAKKEQAELTGKRLLNRYLAERAGSGDYEGYMGVIALAHRDLRDLDEHLRAAINDSDSKEERLDRIVLYIDDLDRCDPERVTDVLDAIHLLLALRLFVVIVGVDPRWLEQSLRDRHPVLLKSPQSSAVRTTSPVDYLEKIFQLTYTLPNMSPERCADLLVSAVRDAQALPTPYGQPGESDDEQEIDLTAQDVDSEDTSDAFVDNVEDDTVEALAEAMTLVEDDIEALRNVAPLVSTSPRRAKRFLNVYLVIRARALGDPALRDQLSSAEDAVLGAKADNTLLVFVALLMGLPKTMAAFIRDMQSPDNAETMTLTTLLVKAATPEEQTRSQAFLTSAESSITKLPMDAIMRWLTIARPYLPLGPHQLQKLDSVKRIDPQLTANPQAETDPRAAHWR